MVRQFIGEKRTRTSEDLKACRHGREFLIPCTHYRDPYFDFTEYQLYVCDIKWLNDFVLC